MVARVLDSVNQAVYGGGDSVLLGSNHASGVRSVQNPDGSG